MAGAAALTLGDGRPGAGGVRALEESVQERLRGERPAAEPLAGPIRFRAVDLDWDPPEGAPLLHIDSVVGTIDPGPLLAGDVIVSSLAVFSPTVNLVRTAEGAEWNYESAFDRIGGPPGPPSSRERLITFEGVAISGGAVLIVPNAQDSIRLGALEATIPRLAFSGPGISDPIGEVARLEAVLRVGSENESLPVMVSDAHLKLPSGGLGFEIARAEVAASRFESIRGSLEFSEPGLGLEGVGRAVRVELADLRGFVPRAPDSGTATFAFSLTTSARGRYSLEASSLELVAEGSTIRGSLGVALGGGLPPAPLSADLLLDPLTIALIEEFTEEPLPYDGTITGRIRGPPGRLQLDLAAQLTTPDVAQPFNAGLVGAVGFADNGFRVDLLDLDLRRVPLVAFRPFVPGLSVDGVVSGHIVLEGVPGEVPMRVDVRLEVAAGSIDLAGSIDITGAVPAYDLSGRLRDLRPEDLFEHPLPPVLLTARFSITGHGVQPATASARIIFDGGFSGWQSQPGDSLKLDAYVDRGRIDLAGLHLRLATLDLAASGIWRFEPPASGAIDYRLTATTLAPFAPYLGATGLEGFTSGPLLAAGSLSGTLDRPRFRGTIEGSSLAYGAWRAETLAATHDFVPRPPITDAEVRLTASGLATPIGPYANAVLDLTVVDGLIDLDLEAEGDAGRGPVLLSARGRVEPGGRSDLVFRRIRFDLDGGTWSLERPARIAWGEESGIDIEGFRLTELGGPGLVAIDGSYPPGPAEELRIEAVDLPFSEILALAGYQPLLVGLLTVDLRATGPAGAATVGGTFALSEASYRGQAIDLVQGTFLVEEGRLDALATAHLDTAGVVRVNASVPLILDLTAIPSVTIPETEPLRVIATADSLALNILSLSIPEVRRVSGMVDGRVEVTGTPARPLFSGAARIEDGAVTVIPLDRHYDQISADLVLGGEVLEVRELLVHSGGWARASGTIGLGDISDPTLALSIAFEDFEAVGADDLEPAEVDGEAFISGSLQAPVVRGAVTLDGGNFSIAIFQSSPTPLTEDLVVTFPASDTAAEFEVEGASWFDRVVIEGLVVEAGENLWVVADEFRARLAGELILNKDAGGLRIAGELAGDRGTFILRAGPLVRRFTLVETSVRFFGTTDLDPAIDVTASRLIPGADGQMSEILIHLTGTLDEPTVSVTTGTGAEVPESELLSFLLFGRPSFAAPGQLPIGGPVLEEAVFGIGSLAELATIGLESAISTELGLPLDFFLIQPTQGPFGGLGGATIIIGQEIAPNLFLTVNTGLGGLFGAAASAANAWSVSLQWRITREWMLELAVEPVNPARFFRGLGTALPVVGVERQLILELQRRWTY